MATITEDYVSFETAELLKEKGFSELTTKAYPYFEGKDYKYDISCPTLQMAMKWLREVHRVCIVPMPVVTDDNGSAGCLWEFIISKHLEIKCRSTYEYELYEDAVEAAIKYCLEHLI